MDLVTHAALGASLAAVVAPAQQRRIAAGVGMAAALLPDADALIQSGSDPLLVLDFHRHFTHALAFVPIGALIAALLLWPLLRRRLPFVRLYAYSFAGYALSGLLDACTSYGTHLLLPFSEAKTAWNLIAVFDPLFTLLLLIPLLLNLRRPQAATVRVGLAIAAAYLALGYVQQQRVAAHLIEVAAARGHVPERLSAKPTLGNLLLWRGLYIHDGRVHADAVRAGVELRHYPGESAALLAAADPKYARDVERFRVFADGWLVQTGAAFVGDARYAMLPTAIAPIWGITWDAADRVDFVTSHAMSGEMRARWLAMLFGR